MGRVLTSLAWLLRGHSLASHAGCWVVGRRRVVTRLGGLWAEPCVCARSTPMYVHGVAFCEPHSHPGPLHFHT